jgi:hypothetical protein
LREGGVVLRARWHILVTSLLAYLSLSLTRDYWVFLITLGIGIFIDVDHFVDYYVRTGKRFTFSIKELTDMHPPYYIPLHSIELGVVLGIVSIYSPVLFYPALSYIVHILMDVAYMKSIRLYFLLFRLYIFIRS